MVTIGSTLWWWLKLCPLHWSYQVMRLNSNLLLDFWLIQVTVICSCVKRKSIKCLTLFNRCVLGVSLDINYEWRYYFILSLSASPEKCLKRTLQSFALLARSLKEQITSEFFFCLSTRTQRLHHLIEQKELCCWVFLVPSLGWKRNSILHPTIHR